MWTAPQRSVAGCSGPGPQCFVSVFPTHVCRPARALVVVAAAASAQSPFAGVMIAPAAAVVDVVDMDVVDVDAVDVDIVDVEVVDVDVVDVEVVAEDVVGVDIVGVDIVVVSSCTN